MYRTSDSQPPRAPRMWLALLLVAFTSFQWARRAIRGRWVKFYCREGSHEWWELVAADWQPSEYANVIRPEKEESW